MNDDRNKRKLYDALSQEYDMGTFEQFSADVEDDGKRRKLYDAIIGEYDLPDFDGFSTQLIGPGTPQQVAKEKPTATPTATSTGNGGNTNPYQQAQPEQPIYDYQEQPQRTREVKKKEPTGTAQFARQMAFEQKVRSSIPSPDELKDIFSQRMENIRKGNQPFSSNSEMRLNPESGKMERVYYTHDGQAVSTSTEQSQINTSLNEQTQTRNDIANLEGNIDAMLDDAASRYTERVVNDKDVQTLADKNAGFFKRVGAAMRFNANYGGWAPGQATKSYNVTPEFRELKAAQRKVRDAKRIIAEADHNAQAGTFGKWLEQSFAGGVVRGFGQNATDLDNWDFGFSDIMDNQSLMSALNAADKGEHLTPSQQALLDATVMEMAVNTYFGSEVGRGYKAGSVTAESLPFMLEMIINPASGVGGTAAAKMTRYALKRFGKAAVKKGGAKYATRKALEIGGRVAGDVLGSAAMTASTGAVRTTADAIDRMNQAQMNGEELDAGKAFAQAFANTTIENYSEMVGTYFEPLMKAAGGGLTRIATSKIGSKVGLDRVRDFIENVAVSDVAQVITDFEKHAKWNGVFGEYAEEVVGGVTNAIIVGDQTLDTNPETGVFNLDNNIDTFLGVSLLGGFMSAVKTVGYRTPKYKARKAMDAANDAALSAFGGDNIAWEPLKQKLSTGTVADVKATLLDVSTNPDYTQEQKMAVLDYANKATAYKGMLTAEQKRRTSGEVDEGQLAAEEAYDRGYDSDESSRRDIAIEFADGTLGSMSQEERQAAWEGVQDRIQDDADNMVEGMREEGAKKQHSDGSFHPETLKEKDEDGNDKMVYIVEGNVQMMADGTMVDPNTSDKSVVVFDPATGDRRMIDPSSDMGILSLNDVTTAEDFESDISRSRDEFVQAALDEVQGTVRVKMGQHLTTPSGKQGTITAVSPDGESFTITAEDGEEVSMERGDLQRVADDAAMAEYQSRHEAKAPVAEEEPAELPEGYVEGAPVEFTPDMKITITDEDGNEKQATVYGRVRSEDFQYVPDENGSIVEYIVDSQVKHDNVDQLSQKVVSHVEPVVAETTEEVAPVEPQPVEGEPQTAVEPAETAVEGETQPEGSVDPMPMREDGEADFMASTPDRGHQYIYNESGLSREEAGQFVKANIDAAEKEFNKLKGKAPKMGTSISKYQQEKAAWQEQIDNSQRVVDYWQGVKSVQNTILAQEVAERAERDRLAHEAAVLSEQQRQAEEIAKQQEQERRGANAVHPAIREKWESAPKVEGLENEITLANGETVKGRYMLVESGAATPSHNPNMEFARNEGFPVDENGQTVNDRDYERDREAQTITRQMGDTYDSRAIQSAPVVSNDGVVLSGNGRTMAGELAAQNGTDGAYIEHLKKYPQQFGFTAEQVEGMQHPRVVFVANENMPYTTETFAKFNQQDMKSQSRTEQAVKLGKTVDDNTFGRIVRSINSFDTLGDFYNDPVAAVSAIRELHQAGAINTMQMAEMMDGEKISGQGRQILENMLIGKAFESNPDAIRQLSEFPAMRQSVVSALAEVANNIKLGEKYSLTEELSAAINLAYQARKSGINAGDRVSWYARQMNLFTFEEGESVADFNNAIVLILADLINDSRVNQLKKTLALYNDNAAMSAAGQYDIFSGGIKSKEDIIKDVLNTLKYGTETEQQQALAGATERRKESVQEDGTAATGSGESEKNTDADNKTEINALEVEKTETNGETGRNSSEQRTDSDRLRNEPTGEASRGGDGIDIRGLQEGLAAERYGDYERGSRNEQEEVGNQIIENAKKNGVYIDNSTHKDFGERKRKPSGESVVYVDEANGRVVKVKNPYAKSNLKGHASSDALYEHIVHNLLFPNTKYRLLGISDSVGEVRFVLEQDYLGKQYTPATQAQIDQYLTDVLGLKKVDRPYLHYDNDYYSITDVDASGDNVLAGEDGTLYFIDPIIKFMKPAVEVINHLSTGNAIAAAEAETDTEPTDGQKKAGNYKMGHVTVDGYDISIENPKGSVRRGTGPNGKAWEQEMHNTYGYIRGTEGVDGDHIDVFLSDDPTQGNVFVVDQVDPNTGKFDEHKVMYGFGSMEEARQAYLSNYEDGWKGLGTITEVSKEKFKKWVESSHRKTKPFAEYKCVKAEEGQNEGIIGLKGKNEEAVLEDVRGRIEEIFEDNGIEGVAIKGMAIHGSRKRGDAREDSDLDVVVEYSGDYREDAMFNLLHESPIEIDGIVVDINPIRAEETGTLDKYMERSAEYNKEVEGEIDNSDELSNAGATITPAQYTTKRGNVLDMQLVKFAEELTKEQQKAARELAKGMKGWWSSQDGGYLMRSAEDAQRLVDAMSSKEAVTDAQPLTLTDMAAASDVAQQTKEETAPEEVTTEGQKEYHGGERVFSTKHNTNKDIYVAHHVNGTVEYTFTDGTKAKADEVQNALPEQQSVSTTDEGNTTTEPKSKWVDEEDAERFEELRRRLRASRGQLNMGVNPEEFAIGVEMSFMVIKHGARKFGEYAKQMIDALGDWVRPYLKAFYNGARDLPESADYEQEMTPYDEVKTFDVMNFDKEGPKDIIATAEEIVRENDAAEQAEIAYSKLKEARNSDRKDVEEEMRARGMRRATTADLESNDTIIYLPGKERGKRVMLITHHGEQVSATQFSEPVITSVTLTDGNTYKPEELWVESDKYNNGGDERIERLKRRFRGEGKKSIKTTAPQAQLSLFGESTGETNNDVEPQNNNTNEKPNVQSGTSEAGRRGQQPQQNGEVGRSAGNETERADDRGVAGRDKAHPGTDGQRSGRVSGVPAGNSRVETPAAEQPKRNLNNNRAERGTDYAPKDVDKRIEANIAAIEKMQELMESGRQATPEEMAVLHRFSGWGGLGKAFNNTSASYGVKPTAVRLRELLGDEGYEQANMSRNSAYYTPAKVIDTMWDIARMMGFKGGKVLEGSAGIGNIIGLMPQDMSKRSDIHAVEIDSTTGNILKLLYPDAKVDVQGFEATQVENGSVDLAITNVPFVTGLRVSDNTGDQDLSKKFHDIHDFCIAKNIRKLREGGIGIFITSSGTLDNSARLREWIIQEGNTDVVGAFRLNNDTFGGTGATSDIIVVRKRVNGQKSANAIDVLTTTGERTAEYDTGETKKVKGEYVSVVKQLSMDYNRYFVEHPENMGGTMKFGFEQGDTYRPMSKALYPVKGKNQAELLEAWVRSFEDKELDIPAVEAESETNSVVYAELGEDVKEGSIVVSDGQLCIAQRGKAVPLGVNANKVKGHTKVECFNHYKSIKDALDAVLRYQTENETDESLQPLINELNRAYDTFIKTYGYLHNNTAISFLKRDVDFANILALEKFSERIDAKSGARNAEYGKTDIFSRRVVEKEKDPEPTNVKDGIIASIYVHGRVDIPWIAESMSNHSGQQVTEQQVKEEIINSGLGFEDTATRQVEVNYEYLSGNVREKLQQAIDANTDGRYDANIKALEEVIPMNIPAHLIDFSIGSSWIEPSLYEEYVKDRTDISVTCTAAGGTWYMKKPYFEGEQKNRAFGIVSQMLHKTIMGTDLIEAAMTNKSITVSETKRRWDGSTETIVDKDATTACDNKIDEIRADFKDWARAKMQSDPEKSARIESIYNDMFNNYVPRAIPDDFVPEHFGGAATVVDGRPFALRPHQGKAVVRATTQPLLLAHEVGTGKTYTLITTAMEMRRLGTAKKPMIVVQNATVGQFVESAKKLYPNAKVLTIEDKEHTADGRKNFYAKIKYNDWDMIVVPQSVFERIPDSPEREMAYIQSKIEEKMLVLEEMRDADPNGQSMIVKSAERELEKLQNELSETTEKISGKRKERDAKKEAVTRQNAEVKAKEMLDRQTDDVENFDDMGIDALMVDEAHEYKHLGFATAMQRGVKGVDPSYSKKSQGVFLKAQAVMERNNGRNVVFATGTPISNTAAEIWTFMRYLMPVDTMKEYGIYYFDDFVRNFGNLTKMLEFTTSGKFKENNRFAGYVNLPELVRIWSGVADTVLTKEAGGVSDKIPAMEGGKAQDIYLPQTKALRSVMKFVKAELDKYDKMTGKEKKAHSHIPPTMYGIAKAAAVDARLVVADAVDEEQSKTNEAVRQTFKSLEDTKEYKGTVAIFADNYQNKHTGFNLYEDIRAKLEAAGVPPEQIVVMKRGMTVKKKLEIFNMVNRGDVRVIMGSTFTLGTGVNIQERLHTLIHLDAPNRPMDYTQRNGRILRQGNLHKEMNIPVRVLRFGVEDSLDVTAYQRLKTKGAIADSIMNGKQMMNNSMENRVLEEEEDVFGDTVAQLSGSEYAMLKNQAEKDVRKYENKKKQWEADQTYCHNEIPRLESVIRNSEMRLESLNKTLAKVEEMAKKQSALTIAVDKQKFGSIDAMADYIKEFNKKVRENESAMREDPYRDTERKLTLKFNIGSFDFTFTTDMSVETTSSQGTLFSAIHRKMTYDCPALELEAIPVHQSLLREGLEDIVNNVITGNDFRERIERIEKSVEKNKRELAQVKERSGKPFGYADELAAAHKHYDEYAELMKQELEEKEKKYAEMDANVEEATGVVEAEEDEEDTEDDEGVLFRTSEELDAEYPDWMSRQQTSKGGHSTQITGTVSTYRKIGEHLIDEFGEEASKLTILDASSGKGVGTKAMRDMGLNVEDVEPYPASDREQQPTYTKYSDIDKQYDVVVSNAVLNVIPDDWRADLLWQMSRLVKPGGRMIINTRGLNDAKTIKHKTILDDESEVLTSTSYQKFFSHETLKDFIEETLGEGWSIENATKNNAGFGNDNAVVVTRLSDGETTLTREGDDYVRSRRSYEESLAASRRAGYSKRQHDSMLERDECRARKQIADFIEKLGLTDRVEVRDDAEGLTGRRAKARGWYNPSNGKIVIILGNHHSKEDVMKTILHEGVGHYGLRAIFGKHFDTFLDNVYLNADSEVRGKIIELAKKHGWNFHTATEEYLSRLAEDTNFDMENSVIRDWWSKIKDLFWEMLHKLGVEVKTFQTTLSDNELRYLLWRSYKNLTEPGHYRSLIDEAEDVVMQSNLKVGQYEEEVKPIGEDMASQASENGILFRDGDFTERDRAIARDHYERMVSSGSYQFKEAVQDSMLGLRKAMEAIDGGKHFRVENVPGNENAYLAENRMSSVNAAEQAAYFREYMQPLLKAVHDLIGDGKAERKYLMDYMMAKHGLERNVKFAERDAQEAANNGADYDEELQKNLKKDYSGLTALTGNAYTAAAEAASQRMVDEFESMYDVSALWDKVNEATKTTLAKVYQSGMLSEESYEQIRDMFEYYIPLRGWDDTTSDEVYGYLTSKDGPLRGSTIKHAYGRSSKADDPIATIGLMADTAIRQGNRNEMKQRFLTYVENHPSDLVSVSKLWLQYDEAKDEWNPVFADIKPEDTAYEVERKVQAFEKRMEQLAEADPNKYKSGRDAINIPYKVVKGNISEHQVLVKRGGETFVLTINGNPRAAQALNGLTNPDVETNGVIGNMLKLAEYTNRQLSSFYTTRTPDFIVSNFFRDMLYSNCMAWVKENPRYALAFHKNFGKVNPATMRVLFGKWENGTLDGSKEIERQFKTFMINGGETGYTSVKDIEGHKKAIASEFKRQGSAARKVWHSLGMQLDLLNRSVENCARFAAFMTSQEFGRSVERSIYDAKEVSVNFNKKGSGGKMVNATGQTFMGKTGSYMSGAGRLFYVFWNAGVQGMTNFGRAAKRHPGKFAAGSATMFALGAIIPLLAKAIGGDDDDDKNAYYNLPEYVRRSNICYRVGEQWVTIPLPIEFRAIYGLGELATGVIGGYEHYSDGELAKQLTSQVSQVLPLDFMEGGGGLHPFIPSVAKPIVEASNNKSWTGLPIYKDNQWNQNDPEFTKVYKNADKHIVAASKWLNEATGGDDYKKGWADVVNPAQVEYVLNGYLGGYFKVPNQLVKMAETATGSREFEWRNMMIANRLIKSGDERTAYRKLQNEYFKYKDEYKETNRLKKKYEEAAKDGIIGYAEKVNFLNNTDEYAHYEIFEQYSKQIDNLYNRMKDEPDEEMRKAIELDYYQVMREMVDAMHEYDASK